MRLCNHIVVPHCHLLSPQHLEGIQSELFELLATCSLEIFQ